MDNIMWDKVRWFKKEAFNCRCCNLEAIDEHLVQLCDKIRDDFKNPIQIVSGARCSYHNYKCGGKKQSYHIAIPERGLLGQAADMAPIKGTLEELKKSIYSVVGDRFGVIEYPTFVHVDVRKQPYRGKKE